MIHRPLARHKVTTHAPLGAQGHGVVDVVHAVRRDSWAVELDEATIHERGERAPLVLLMAYQQAAPSVALAFKNLMVK